METRECNNPAPAHGGDFCTGANARLCQDKAYCNNCTLTQWSRFTPCDKTCGGGLRKRSRRVLTPAGPGGVCFPLEETQACNTQFCRASMGRRGYYVWGPIEVTTPTPIRYRFGSNRDVDVFLFDAENYQQYLDDVAREPPFNYGYSAVRASLDDNIYEERVTLQPGRRYYLVVDHTEVGVANGQNGNLEVRVDFSYSIEGIDLDSLPEPLNTSPNAARSVLPSLTLALSAILAVLLLQRQ